MRVIPIVFAFDKLIEMPAGVAISSLLLNADKDTFYDIFVMHSDKLDFSNSRINELTGFFPNCRITFRPVKDEFVGAFEIRGITETCYYRLLIPELIPEYDKVLYSDVDVIFREDLTRYYNTPLGNNYFGSVNSVPVMNDDYLSYIRKIGIIPETGYFYSGNLIINSKKIREDYKIAEFRSHKEQKYRFQDMDIINLTCNSKIKPLPIAFCMTGTYYDALIKGREKLKDYYTEEEMNFALKCGIVHYNGAKPWKEVCLNMDIWWDYYRKSIFFDEKFVHDFWYNQTYRIEKMSLWKRIKQVARYFREGGRM